MSEHIPNLSEQESLEFGEIDLQIEEAIRNMDEALPDLEPADRTMVILHMRWAYIDGYYAGWEDAAEAI